MRTTVCNSLMLITFLVVVFSGCRKPRVAGNIIIRGTITDAYDQSPIENVITLIGRAPSLMSNKEYYRLGIDDTSDSGGNFYCEYNNADNDKYVLVLKDPTDTFLRDNYVVLNEGFTSNQYNSFAAQPIASTVQNNLTISLGRRGRLRVDVKSNPNFNPQNFIITGVGDFSPLENKDTTIYLRTLPRRENTFTVKNNDKDLMAVRFYQGLRGDTIRTLVIL